MCSVLLSWHCADAIRYSLPSETADAQLLCTSASVVVTLSACALLLLPLPIPGAAISTFNCEAAAGRLAKGSHGCSQLAWAAAAAAAAAITALAEPGRQKQELQWCAAPGAGLRGLAKPLGKPAVGSVPV
jgi:hypothetical protein